MNHCVPNFDTDEDFNDLPPTASSSGSARHNIKKPAMAEEDIMELLWQNGQVVMQTQNQRSFPKSNFEPASIRAEQAVNRQPGEGTAAEDHHVFLEEDEMASWLHYPLHEQAFDGRDLYSDLLYPPAASSAPLSAAIHPREIRPAAAEEISQPPIQMRAKCAEIAPPRIQNFSHFSRLSRGRIEPGPSSSSKAPIESTIVDSCETPQFSRANVRRGNRRSSGATALPSAGVREESVTCEQTVTSSPGGSEDSGSAEPSQNPELVSWKRKQRDVDEMEGQSEDMDLESLDTKKEGRSGCASTKRSRAAQVHNLSERRRRDRINEKMKALQELIPRCTKSDKASMLDDAIEYLKSLQLQVQMMTLGCGMVPMMYPASMQQFMQTGTMGMNMMRMCGMNRPPMVPPPYPPPPPPPPPLIPSSSRMPSPSPTAAAQMNPTRFPISPPFPFPVPDPSSRLHASNQSGSVLTPLVAAHNPNQQQIPNFADPYKQLLGFHQAQVTLPLNQTLEHPIKNKPSSSKDVGNHQS